MSTAPLRSATLLQFLLDQQPFALDVVTVREVQRMVTIRPIAGLPPEQGLLGLIEARGQTVPVLDMKRRVNLPASASDSPDEALIFVESRQRLLALSVTRATGIVYVPMAGLPAPDAGWDCVRGLIRVKETLITLLDAEKLPTPELEVFWGLGKNELVAIHR